jgi:hypothetical protein
MAILPLSKDNFDFTTLELHPKRKFSSSSSGLTGSVYVFAEHSPALKEQHKLSAFDDSTVDSSNLEETRIGVFASASEQSNIYSSMEQYLEKVSSTATSNRLLKQVEVTRFEPTNTFTSDTLRKSVVMNTLYQFYRPVYPSLNFAYTNYNCLNFFTSSMVPSCSALIYPAPVDATAAGNLYNSPSGWTFAFHVNPNQNVDNVGDEYRAGTIMHMSKSYALSVITGSRKGDNGKPSHFRIMLQLSHSAGIPPSEVPISEVDAGTNGYPYDLIFLSPDNSIKYNNWEHIAVSWSSTHNNGTGSFYIGGQKTNDWFNIPSASLNEHGNDFNPVFIGNFYGAAPAAGYSLGGFFNTTAASAEGIYSSGLGIDKQPPSSALTHPLRAGVHDIRIYKSPQTEAVIYSASFTGPSNYDDMMFYLPPFFTKESKIRDVLKTPFQTARRATHLPFNAELSFGVDGKDINLQNHTREMVNNNHPRNFFLSSSTVDATTNDALTSNVLLWESASFAPSMRYRNMLVLPCDNGKFIPNFELLKSGSLTGEKIITPPSGSLLDRYVTDLGRLDYTLVTLRNMLPTGSIFSGLKQSNADGTDDTSSTGILQEIVGSSPETPSTSTGQGFTILQRTRDNSSNEVIFLDASNLFYGMMIRPGTLTITDPVVTGSGGGLSMVIKDDGRGNLYRANCLSPQADWSSVGNVIYEEGIMIIKNPNIPSFGKDAFELSFEGVQNVHTMEINVFARAGKINSSSNPTFDNNILPNDYVNDLDTNFTSLSGIVFHDDNLNVIMRTNFAQPVVKKQNDKYLFRVKIDF